MSIRCQCANCGATYKVADESTGKRIKCAKCAAVFVVAAIADEPIAVARPTAVKPANSDMAPAAFAGVRVGGSSGGAGKSSGAYRIPKKSPTPWPMILGGGAIVAAAAVGGWAVLGGGLQPPAKKSEVVKKDPPAETKLQTVAPAKKESPAVSSPTATASRSAPKAVDNGPTPFKLPPEQPAEGEAKSPP